VQVAIHTQPREVSLHRMATDNTRALRDDPARHAAILERIPAGRWAAPEDIAGAAVFLASSASDYVQERSFLWTGAGSAGDAPRRRRRAASCPHGHGWRPAGVRRRHLRPAACGSGYPRDHCWLLPPLQVHSSTSAPLAVPAPVTSRHRPERALVTLPLDWKFHCWLSWPLHE